MDARAVNERFLDFEREHDLFDREANGVRYWERVRFIVHRRIRQGLGLIGQARSPHNTSKFERLAKMAQSLAVRSPFLAPESELLVWGHERRKRRDDGHWWDIYSDPWLESAGCSATYLEQPHEGGHRKPARTDDVRHLDAVVHAPGIPLQLVGGGVVLDAGDRAQLGGIADALGEEFGVGLDLAEMVGRRLLRRRICLPLFRRIVRRIDPDLAVLVVSYGRETFVEACRKENVPTVELQHGVIGPYHFGYSFPGEREKRAFPDYFLSFGEFWDDAAEFPLPEDRIYPVGYPFLESEAEALTDRDPKGKVAFVSQGTVGADISRAAVAFTERTDRDVVYKLHPDEYSRWREAYPWLADAADSGNLRVVGEEGESLYELFADSDVQVGAYSTALYEGLCFDLATYVLDLPEASYMDPLVADGAATKVSDAGELATRIDEEATCEVNTERFFRPNGVENVLDALADIRERER